eukprot:1822255-Ditylum_brightwellii.AAC.1
MRSQYVPWEESENHANYLYKLFLEVDPLFCSLVCKANTGHLNGCLSLKHSCTGKSENLDNEHK